jgi:type IV secretory pathway TraG/TraD family ATPase VirD4
MEKPYAILKEKPLAAPMDDMEEIVIATLNAMQFSKFMYVDTPKTIQATRDNSQIWGEKTWKGSYTLEIIWEEDPNPPPQFENLALENNLIQPLLVTIIIKDNESNDQSEATQICKSLWNQLRERAQVTSKAAKTKKKPTDHGSAAWATVDELQHEGYVQELSQEEPSTRLLLGTHQNHTISVPKRFTEAHAVVTGPPGVGKSRTIFIPNLMERLKTSAIVTEVVAGEDIKPVVYRMTAGYRQFNGHKVFYLNPSDLSNSTRFNPIDFIQDMDDAIYYADLIITNTTEKSHIGDQIWKQSETHLLTALLLYVWGLGGKKKSEEGGMSNLGHVRSLLQYGPINLMKLINSNGIPEAKARFGEFVRNSSPNFRLGVFSGLIQRLNPFLNPKLMALTEVSDFTADELRNNLFTFYLAYPVHRTDYRPLMALAVNFLMRLALKKKFTHPLTLLLDEFAAYGYIPEIDNVQATIRNQEIGIVLGFQDVQQLHKVYPTQVADVLFNNSETKVLFATGSPKAQQTISQLLGQETRVKKQVSSSGHITKQTYGAPLLTPGEVGTKLKDGEVLVWRNKKNPIIVKTANPGKYNAYEQTYPPPEKPKKYVDPAAFDEVEDTPQFSESEAEQQIATYKKLWEAKVHAQTKLDQAKQQGISPEKITTLENQLEAAKTAYDKFVEPNPNLMPKDETEEKELLPKSPPKKPSEQTAEAQSAKTTTSDEQTETITTVTVKPKSDTPVKSDDGAVVQEDVDPWEGQYDPNPDDPFKGQYDTDES